MDFALTEEQKQILDTVDRLMQKEFPPEEVRRRDASGADCSDLIPLFGRAGLLALPFPKEFGGLEADRLTCSLVAERLAYHATIASALFSITTDAGGMSLLLHGTEQQKGEMLPRLIQGELRFALAITESNAGSDAAAAVTSARKTDKGWVINGRKTWISSADAAHYLVTLCRSGRGTTGKDGLSLFLIPRSSPGIHMTQLSKIGNNCMSSWDIAFDDVEIPDSALLGEAGRGFRAVMKTLMYSRINHAAKAVGIAQAAVDAAKDYALSRNQFGHPIANFQVIRHRLVDMQTLVDQARLLVYHGGWLMSQGMECRRQVSQAKVVAAEALQSVTQHGMQITASFGYSSESDMQRYWRDGRLYSFGEGTNELQRDLIARDMGL